MKSFVFNKVEAADKSTKDISLKINKEFDFITITNPQHSNYIYTIERLELKGVKNIIHIKLGEQLLDSIDIKELKIGYGKNKSSNFTSYLTLEKDLFVSEDSELIKDKSVILLPSGSLIIEFEDTGENIELLMNLIKDNIYE